MTTVSVIIPVWNSGEYLTEAVRSIVDSAADRSTNIVLVDDHSTDRATVDVIRELQTSFDCVDALANCEGRKGAGSARNVGIAHSTADWLMFLDSDDVFTMPCFGSRLNVIKNSDVSWLASDFSLWHPGSDATATGYFESRGESYKVPEQAYHLGHTIVVRKPVTDLIDDAMPVNTISVTVKRDLCIAAGGFGESLAKAEDTLLWLKLARMSEGFAFIPEVHAKYRIRSDSLTHEDAASGFWIAGMLRILLADEQFASHRPAIRKRISRCFIGDSFYYREHRAWLRACASAARAAYWNPRNIAAWKTLVASMLLKH